MTVPKWLIPVICVIAALAVGVAASLFAVRFAPAAVPEASPPQVETVPVLAPVEDPAAAFPAEGDEGFEVSEATGTVDVVVPEDGTDRVIEDLAAEADAIAGGSLIEDDPADDSPAPESPAGGDPSIPVLSDPCDSDDPPADADCDGIMSTVFALTAAPPFTVELRPLDRCGTEAPAGSFEFSWLTTQPGEFSVRAWQTEPDSGIFGLPIPDSRMFTTSFATSPDDEAEWNAAREADVPLDDLPTFYGCAYLTGLDADTYYTVEVTGVNREGELITRAYEFTSGGPFARRAMVVQPSTGSGGGWTVSLVHAADEQFSVRAYRVSGGTTRCDLAEDSPGFVPLDDVYRTTGTLSVTQTQALGVSRDQNRNTVFAYLIPAGERVLFCAGLFAAGDAPSWERDFPIREFAQAATAADWVLPRIRITDAELFRDDVDVWVTASTGVGYTCGSTRVEPGVDFGLESLLLCQLEHFGAHWDRSSGGFDGDLDDWDQLIPVVIRTTVELPGGERLTSSHALELVVCSWVRGPGCALRLESFERQYDIALPAERTGSGICGSSFGPCEPPTRETATGALRLTVDWPDQRLTSGGDRVEAPIPSDRLPRAANLEPSMNTDARIEYAGMDVDSFSAIAALDLQTDVEADYRVELHGVGGLDPCRVDDAELVATGRVSDSTRVEIPGACFGGIYSVTVTLTGDNGFSSVWGLGRTHRWLGGLLFVPGLEALVAVTAFHGEVEAGTMLAALDATVDGVSLGLVAGRGNCLDDGMIDAVGSGVVEMSSYPELSIHVGVADVASRSGSVCTAVPGDLAPPYVLTLDTADLLRHREGVNFAVGSYTFLLRVFPAV
jgi:hypothetical protein